MPETIIKLLYLEDHPVMIRGFRDIFRSNRDSVNLAVYASTAEDAVNKVQTDRFDIIILDLFLGDADPLANIRKLTEHFPDKPIIVYTSHTGVGLMKEVFQLGVRAWILKTAGTQEIKETITRVFCGDTIFPQELLRHQVNFGVNNPGASRLFVNLHPDKEQLAILNLLCEGKTTHQIATQYLKLTLSSVEKKLQIMRELAEVKSNIELVILYLRHFGSKH